jgi:hypothetical protein
MGIFQGRVAMEKLVENHANQSDVNDVFSCCIDYDSKKAQQSMKQQL